ncbi:hypothetical protein OG871_39835 (plasmid) [Kitasatospora sp. NBC_00374]|uniref:hypothetical protein n=1 Tax=Kitasatospora sp. NBC_00374 TaxID=2975964 RepID=UPI002F917D96
MPQDPDLPALAMLITPQTHPDQALESVLLLAAALLPITVDSLYGPVRYEPAVSCSPGPVGAGDDEVLAAYGAVPSLGQLLKETARAYHAWRQAVGEPVGDDRDGVRAGRLGALERRYLLCEAVVLDIACLRDGDDPRGAAECVGSINRLRALYGLAGCDEWEARAWLRYVHATDWEGAALPVRADASGPRPSE